MPSGKASGSSEPPLKSLMVKAGNNAAEGATMARDWVTEAVVDVESAYSMQ